MSKANLNFSKNAIEILNYRYLGSGESPRGLIRRVARTAANVEDRSVANKWAQRFRRIITNLDFMPNTPALINAGKKNQQLSACFVLGIDDSTESIFNTLRDTALVHKTGGGTGFDFSKLRPEGYHVDDTSGTASGPVSFMRVYNAATREMKQGGVRRGANMGILRVDHPDIEKFITCKNVEGELANFNISVAITDEFMECLLHEQPFALQFGGKHVRSVYPRYIWNLIIEGAHRNGEPGIIFIDRINEKNPLKEIETICATNPCGEQPLPENGSCNLGHINVSNFWDAANETIEWSRLGDVIEIAVRFLDNNIDASSYPTPQIRMEALDKRRIGLGIMGLADLFLLMGTTYGSDRSVDITHKLMRFISEEADVYSKALGREKGKYPAAGRNHKLPQRRNGTITTVAPTGSCSILANCSSGIEPIFAYSFKKKCIDGYIDMYHPFAEKYLKEGKPLPEYFVTAEDVSTVDHIRMQAIVQDYVDTGISKTINAPNDCTLEQVDEAFWYAYDVGCKSLTFYRSGSREYEAQTKNDTDRDAGREERVLRPVVEIEGVGFGGTADGGPSDEDMSAFANGIINAARSENTSDTPTTIEYSGEELFSDTEPEEVGPFIVKRPRKLQGFTSKIKTGRGKLYVTVNEDVSGRPIELFAKIGHSGKEDYAYTEALGRAITLALRWGVPLDVIHKHLSGITGYDTTWDCGRLIKSVPDAIATILELEYPELVDDIRRRAAQEEGLNQTPDPLATREVRTGKHCPDCFSSVVFLEGCHKCVSCGWSQCGG